jgi:molybdopterin-guanine dinucleotide biosynthesis protein B
MRIIGLAGWSGAGKTTLVAHVLPALARRGLRVSTVKHAHHAFEIDQPGKDSFIHRKAGAFEVLVASSERYAIMRDLRGEPEPSLAEHLARLTPVDLVIVEGFKRDAIPKIEIFREANGKPLLHPQDPAIVALASDLADPPGHLPHAKLDDVAGVADLVLRFARPV